MGHQFERRSELEVNATPEQVWQAVGDRVRSSPDRLLDGVVYAVNPQTLGVRTSDALYRFLQGLGGSLVAAHHLFAEPDPDRTGPDPEPAWQDWLSRLEEHLA